MDVSLRISIVISAESAERRFSLGRYESKELLSARLVPLIADELQQRVMYALHQATNDKLAYAADVLSAALMQELKPKLPDVEDA